MLGADHPDTLKALTSLAMVYRQQGKLAEAEPLCLQARLEACRRVLGKDQLRHGANPRVRPGNCLLRDQGKLVEAEPLLGSRRLRLTAACWVRITPPRCWPVVRPDRVISETGQAGRGRADGSPDRLLAVETQRGAPRARSTPTRSGSLNQLAWVYLDQGKLAEAEPLFVQVWEVPPSRAR